MPNELTYEELNDQQREAADGAIVLESATSKYLVNDFGQVTGYRLAEMFNAGKPMKWSPPLDLKTGEPLPPPKTRSLDTLGMTPARIGEAAPGLAAPGSALIKVRIVDIDRCPLNPRQNFNRERLDELKQSFRAHRFVEEMSHLWVRPHPTQPGRYELIDGERRWIVVGELVREEMFGGLVPVSVSNLTDTQVLEFALVNAMQREGLSPIEEAEAICRLLEMPKADGSLPTAAEVAGHLGCKPMHVTRCKLLRRLRGTPAGAAIEDGRLSKKHGEILGRVASPKLRDDLTRRVLEPSDHRGAMPAEILQEWVKAEVQIDLRTANFDPTDEQLVPLVEGNGERLCGGACARTMGVANNPTDWTCPFVETSQGKALCMHPVCFRAKQTAGYEQWRKTTEAAGANIVTVPAEEADRLWDQSGKRLAPSTGYVEIEAKPEDWELKAGVVNALTWKRLIRGQGSGVRGQGSGVRGQTCATILVVKDRSGEVHELVKRDLAKQVARDQGYDIFRGAIAAEPAGPADSAEEGDARIAAAAEDTTAEIERERRATDRNRAVLIAERTEMAVHRDLVEQTRGLKRLDFQFWRLLLAPMMEAVREGGRLASLCEVLGKSEHLANDVDNADFLERTVRETDPVHLPSVALMLARWMLYPNETAQWLKLATKEFKVDVKAIGKRIVAEIEAEERAEAERLEIEHGVAWSTPVREKADEFTWLNDGDCANANVAALAMPHGVKWTAMVGVARTPKGWHMGYELRLGKKLVKQALPNRNTVSYGNPALALKAALLGIEQAMEDGHAPEAARARIAAYVAGVQLPAEKPKPPGKKTPRRKDAKGRGDEPGALDGARSSARKSDRGEAGEKEAMSGGNVISDRSSSPKSAMRTATPNPAMIDR